MRPYFLFSASILAFLTASTTALRAVPSQQCAGVCGDVTTTKNSDIVCSDSDFQNTDKGKTLISCLNCQQNSTASDPNTGESDLRWFIYNVRFTLSSCLWAYPSNQLALSTPCTTNPACGLYQSNMAFDSLLPNASTFDFCSGFDGRVNAEQPRCINCLQQLRDDFYMSNFFIALVAGCQQKPSPGSLLGLQGSLFSSTTVNITSATSSATAVATAQTTTGLALPAIVGAVIGGVVALLALLACGAVIYGKRRRRLSLERAQNRASVRTSRPLGGHVAPRWGQDTPGEWSQDDTPTTAGGYGSDKQVFSPYTSPVSARDMLNPKQMWEAHPPNMSAVQMAVKAKNEAIEMEKMRDQRIEERRIKENQMHERFLQDAAAKGFTTIPIIRAPSISRDPRGKEKEIQF